MPPVSKPIKAVVLLQLEGGKATPAPPVGPALSQHKVSSMQFVKEYNERTAKNTGEIIPTVVTIYNDGSFTFVLKSSPTSILIKKELSLEKASSSAGLNIVAEITREQLKKIAEIKIADLNTTNIESAMNTVAGCARSMGIKVAAGDDA